MHLYEKTLDRTIIYEGKIFTVARDNVELEDGKRSVRELVLHTGGAGILPIDEDGNVTLVKQYRSGAACQMLEMCAGKTEKGEDPRECAIRELKEELGITAENIISLGTLVPTPAYDSEVISIYLATGITRGERQLDAGEFADVVEMPFERALELVMSGEITDAKTQVALLKAERLRNGKA